MIPQESPITFVWLPNHLEHVPIKFDQMAKFAKIVNVDNHFERERIPESHHFRLEISAFDSLTARPDHICSI
jgi:hypothetical protein